MVIKSKKWTTIVSFGAFVLGLSLLLQSGASLIYRIWAEDGIREIMEEDYQNTKWFESCIQARFLNLLALATGGTVNGSYSLYYEETGLPEDWWMDTAVVYEETTAEEGDAWGLFAPYAGNASTATEEVIPREELEAWEEEAAAQKQWREQQKQEFLRNIEPDKNLLYRVSYDGKALYSNMDDVGWSDPEEELPDGYNYLLVFDGEKVRVWKDGTEQDIYGDGYYRGGEDWYVPGYKNFTVDEQIKKAEIVMLAAKEPILYSTARYGETGGIYEAGNTLYYIAEDLKNSRRQAQEDMAGIIFGILFLAVYLRMRADKRRADEFLGRVTGKIWLEGKMLVFGAVAAMFCFYWGNYYRYYVGDVISEIAWQIYYGEPAAGYLTGELARELLGFLEARPGMFLTAFWLLYLMVNDIRKNRRSFWRGGISRFVENARTGQLALTFSKRMVRRFLPVYFVSLFLVVTEFLLVLFGGEMDYIMRQSPWIILLPLGFGVVLFLWVCRSYLSGTKRQAEELDFLAEQIGKIHDGNYSEDVCLPEDAELKPLSEQLVEIRQGMEAAVEERIKSERMKVELVANVSHDIRTPLTSIISYVQFLKQEEDLPEHVKDYIRILDEKSERLNAMVQDVFAVSKAASGQLPVKIETLDFAKLLRQTLADMEERIAKSPVTMRVEIPEQEVMIQADGGRMYRVFQNLIQNALTYSLQGSRVYLTLKEDASVAVASIKNTSGQELGGTKDFTERFVRGDGSRTDGGSGLGLSIAKSFTEACKGQFEVETIADLFVVTVSFPTVPNGKAME